MTYFDHFSSNLLLLAKVSDNEVIDYCRVIDYSKVIDYKKGINICQKIEGKMAYLVPNLEEKE